MTWTRSSPARTCSRSAGPSCRSETLPDVPFVVVAHQKTAGSCHRKWAAVALGKSFRTAVGHYRTAVRRFRTAVRRFRTAVTAETRAAVHPLAPPRPAAPPRPRATPPPVPGLPVPWSCVPPRTNAPGVSAIPVPKETLSASRDFWPVFNALEVSFRASGPRWQPDKPATAPGIFLGPTPAPAPLTMA